MGGFGIRITKYPMGQIAPSPDCVFEFPGLGEPRSPALTQEAFDAFLAQPSMLDFPKSRRMAQILNAYVSGIPRTRRVRWAIERKLRAPLNPLKDRRDEIERCDCCGHVLGVR